MPAKDKYHQTVKNALAKAGWDVDPKEVLLELEKRHFWIDIRAKKQNENRIIMVEVKVFEKMPSPVEYLMSSVGQYVVYRAIIEASDNPQPLYMAVPFSTYQTGILSEAIG
jgi:hypothetical protein